MRLDDLHVELGGGVDLNECTVVLFTINFKIIVGVRDKVLQVFYAQSNAHDGVRDEFKLAKGTVIAGAEGKYDPEDKKLRIYSYSTSFGSMPEPILRKVGGIISADCKGKGVTVNELIIVPSNKIPENCFWGTLEQ